MVQSAQKAQMHVDGTPVLVTPGQSVLQACDEAGIYIPRLCSHPDLEPAGNCRVCTCKINGRNAAACVTPAMTGMVVENNTPELTADRRSIIEMLFVEGNHTCAYCVASGDCELQALGYRLGLVAPTLPYLWPDPKIDATHPDIYLDRNRCILCSRCIRASRME
ncbi:MAG: 2Fe-2S iron-sulfur cluster-binding protein, partial [Burkholderiaceae bacterium]